MVILVYNLLSLGQNTTAHFTIKTNNNTVILCLQKKLGKWRQLRCCWFRSHGVNFLVFHPWLLTNEQPVCLVAEILLL
jgi:hypothetical protein